MTLAMQSKEISIDASRKAWHQLIITSMITFYAFFALDASGIIMGEFGFITADDVYHITVYATDENGNFKIVSMKNVKLMKGPVPQARTPFVSITTTSTTPQPFMVKTTAKAVVAPPASTNDASCASCSLPVKPETETIKPTDAVTDVPPPFKVVGKDEVVTTIDTPTTSQADALPLKIVSANLQNPPPGSQGGNSNSRFGSNGNANQISGNPSSPGGRQPAARNEKLEAPKFFNKNAGNVEHYNKMEKLMNGLLYRFNYTTDFQGHREEGDRQGNKDGEYYSVGRDNVKRIVSYKANEFGYMPYIRQEPISSQDLQYYDERNNKLRGYNFEWFYP